MINTGLKRFETATVDNFTSEFGLNTRKTLNAPWKEILKLATSKKVIIEQNVELDKNKQYVFACNHSFDEDVISILQSLDRNAYVLNGSTDQTEHNPIFLALWLNGMIYVNRQDKESRADALRKMKKVIEMGSNIMLFPEGGYNNTENRLIAPLFPGGVYDLSVDKNIEVVPVISFNDYNYHEGSFDDKIYIRIGKPMDLSKYERYEASEILRDEMSTMVYDILLEHDMSIKREDLGKNPRERYMEIRKKVYECQKWYHDVWDEELTFYPGHNVTLPANAFEYVNNINITSENAALIAPLLARVNEEKEYELTNYLRKNLKLSK